VLAATKLTAFLTINQEIPAPQGARGSGTFTATFSGNTIEFRLTYKGLTGAAAAAHIHVALAGKANPAPAVSLCGPCKNGQTGTVAATTCGDEEDPRWRHVREHPHSQERRRRDPRPDRGPS
jgi:hypothetical protein